MNKINLLSAAANPTLRQAAKPAAPSAAGGDNPALRKAFNQFVGETFYGQMIQAMRKTQGKPAYFNGGRAEEVFTQQLDQALTKKLAETRSEKLSGSMYKLFTQSRR